MVIIEDPHIELQFEIPGRAKGAERARVSPDGIIYTPKATKIRKDVIRKHYQQLYPQHKARRGVPVSLAIFAYIHHKGTGGRTIPATNTPDIDNIAKLVMDALTGVAWEDDKQITSLLASKYWTPDESKTSITISWDREEKRHHERTGKDQDP